jgi:Cu/Ag efflux protein CusF
MTMRLWRVVVLLNLALALGAGAGLLYRAREIRALRQELADAREAVATRAGSERQWSVRGIVRVPLPSQSALFVTHEAVPELMEGMTMGFEVADPRLLDGLKAGDPIRFTLRQDGQRLRIVAIQKEARQ